MAAWLRDADTWAAPKASIESLWETRRYFNGEAEAGMTAQSDRMGMFGIIRANWAVGASSSKVALVLAALALALCTPAKAQAPARMATESEWKAIVAAAEKEGKVTIYSAAAPAVQTRLKAAFEKAFPRITVEWARFGSGALMAKVDQERSMGAEGADVVATSETSWIDANGKQGMLRAPVGPAVREWPPAFLRNGMAPILAMDPIVMMINTNLVKIPVTGQKDLLRPELKGKIGLEEIASTFGAAWYDQVERGEEPGYLAKLATQQTRVYPSTVALAQSVSSGEISIANFVNLGAAFEAVQRGAPVRIIVPEPVYASLYIGAILGWSKQPNAAMVFMDYLMSRAGQEVWSGDGGSASPLPTGKALDARKVRSIELAPYTSESIAGIRQRFESLFKR